jgi:hypothetical protein
MPGSVSNPGCQARMTPLFNSKQWLTMPFKPGQSGNPGGRPKENEEIKKLALKHCPKAIKRLADLMDDPNSRTAVAACDAILDRGIGKPPQALEHSGMIATTHEELLKQLDSLPDDADREDDTPPAEG